MAAVADLWREGRGRKFFSVVKMEWTSLVHSAYAALEGSVAKGRLFV